MLTKDHYLQFANWVREPKQVVITTHMHPDGDALGSEIGLQSFLESIGHEVTLLNADPASSALEFLFESKPLPTVFKPGSGEALLEKADKIFLLDNAAPDRFGSMEQALVTHAKKTFCIDHHPPRDNPWQETILDVEASATCEIIYDLVKSLNYTPDLRTAQALYVGIATDTGFFRFNSTTSNALKVASELLALNVEPAAVYKQIHERNSLAFTSLLGYCLSNIQLSANQQIASVLIPQQILKSLEAEGEDLSEVANTLLAMDGVQVALLFKELSPDSAKVSLRSKGLVNVHQLAIQYGGGGHRNASGIVMKGDLNTIADTIIEKASGLVEAT